MRWFRHAQMDNLDRREMLRLAAAGIGVMATGGFRMLPAAEPGGTSHSTQMSSATADAVIFLYMGGGQAAAETWDPKRHTPFVKGMRAADVYSTFPAIPTSADGIQLSQGLEQVASVMHLGLVIPTFRPGYLGTLFHVRHIFHLHTCYKPPQTVAVPSIGAVIARTLGSRQADVPAYVDIGQRLNLPGVTNEVRAAHSPGFLGSAYGPFAIPDPTQAVSVVRPPAGMSVQRFADRQRRLRKVQEAQAKRHEIGAKREEFVESVDAAHRLLGSPAAKALDLDLEPRESFDIYNKSRFGQGCLLARRMIEAGSRFVQVSHEFVPFENFDTHESGHARVKRLKQEIDAPIAQLVRDLHERGLLKRTLIVLATEFSRSMLVEGDGGRTTEDVEKFLKQSPGDGIAVPATIEDEKHYGMHRHFSGSSSVVMFGGGLKEGIRYGRTGDDPPFDCLEHPVEMEALHATIYHALGISPKLSYEIEGRPFYVTPDGHGKPVLELFA